MRQYECFIKPQSGEIIQTAIPLPPEEVALITGTVLGPEGHPVPGALVLLLRQEDDALPETTVTDGEGRFYLGPVTPELLYTLRVQVPGARTRVLELTV